MPRKEKCTLFCKGSDSKYFRVWGRKVSVATAQLCHPYSTEAAIDNT